MEGIAKVQNINLPRRKLVVAAAIGGLLKLLPSNAFAQIASQGAGSQWDRAAAFDAAIDKIISSQKIVGLTVVAAKSGHVVYERTAGFGDREAKRVVGPNEIYRIASMTKALVCVTGLSFIEKGKLSLEDPVSKWLPYFMPKTQDGKQPVITIRHLMTHTAGLTYGFLEPEDGIYHKLGVSDGLDNGELTLEENLRRLASAPLLYEPGTSWGYSLAIDVLGGVIEQVAQASLQDAVKTTITDPLGLDSLKFSVPKGTVVATAYADSQTPPVRMTDSFRFKFGKGAIVYSPSRAFNNKAFPSGGVGMVGTARDYLKFVETIRMGGGRIITPKSAAAFTTNALGDLPMSMGGPGFGWGLGVAVLKDPSAAGLRLGPGSWNWSGVYGTNFWVDPVAELSVVALTNTAIGGMAGSLPGDLRHAAYNG
ncbi:serine hydrolase domain-containing protein [Acidicapsa ligni]|uniref:serine hydrolase domain-containing protein n=1 Tax=Acidicapsa ligni TaxID=542300 RepID=UPI0021E090F7|nr:serine hydrolase domain-containing protein [Acidicapsa ligni]